MYVLIKLLAWLVAELVHSAARVIECYAVLILSNDPILFCVSTL